MAERRTVPRQTARRMMRETLRRNLVPGDRLASEPTLLGHFGVSRGSLREALRLLSFLGAIDIRSGPGGGARIAMPQPRVVGSALAMALQFRAATLRSLLEARAAMEPAIAGLAATHRRDQDLAALDACLDRLSAPGDPGRHREGERFHQLVAAASGNEVLAILVAALTWISTAVEYRHEPQTERRLVEERIGIADAILARDSCAAGARTAAVFRAILDDLERHQPEQLAARVVWPDVDELDGIEDRRDETSWTH